MIKGFIILFAISLTFALIGWLIGSNPIAWFLLATIVQILFNYALNMALKTWGQINVNRLITERENSLSKNTVEVECSACKEVNEVEIILRDQEKEFDCKKCNKTNRVIVNIETVQKTLIPDNNLLTYDAVKNMEQKLKEEEQYQNG